MTIAATRNAAITVISSAPVRIANGPRSADATTEPSEMYLVHQTVTRKMMPPIAAAWGARIENTPHVVATPLPPRKPNQTG
jgi:hypothetical protein